MTKPTILLCNDDGYYAEGIQALRDALGSLGRVISVAPDKDNSGVSHKITINSALRLREVGPDSYAVSGTPVDCVHLALHGVLEGRLPDVMVSGINHGPNLGEATAYSGTVGAAYEAYTHSMPALAISAGQDDGVYAFEKAGDVAYQLVKAHLDGHPFLREALWNVNVPPGPMKGMRVARLDRRSFKSSVVKRTDPRGQPYYWIGPYHAMFDNEDGTDHAAYCNGYVSISPLKVEMTHHEMLDQYSHSSLPFVNVTGN